MAMLCFGGSASAQSDPSLTLSTIPERVLKTPDSSKFETECWYFDLMVRDAKGRTLEPVQATIELVSGDPVSQGRVVGKLGNSGDSNMPHLHYQLMNGPVMFVADGLPFKFEDLNETSFAPGTYLTPKK